MGDHHSDDFFSSAYGGGDGGADFIIEPPLAPARLGLGAARVVAAAAGRPEGFDAGAMR